MSEEGSNSSDKKNKIFLIISLLNLIITLGILSVVFLSYQKDKSKPNIDDISLKEAKEDHNSEESHSKDEESEKEKNLNMIGKMIPLDPFTINLSTLGSSNTKYVRANISIEVSSVDTETELNLKIPQVRNVIIDLFNSKKNSDLSYTEGRDYLKEEIKNRLNSFLVTGKVKNVFFTNFALSG